MTVLLTILGCIVTYLAIGYILGRGMGKIMVGMSMDGYGTVNRRYLKERTWIMQWCWPIYAFFPLGWQSAQAAADKWDPAAIRQREAAVAEEERKRRVELEALEAREERVRAAENAALDTAIALARAQAGGAEVDDLIKAGWIKPDAARVQAIAEQVNAAG